VPAGDSFEYVEWGLDSSNCIINVILPVKVGCEVHTEEFGSCDQFDRGPDYIDVRNVFLRCNCF